MGGGLRLQELVALLRGEGALDAVEDAVWFGRATRKGGWFRSPPPEQAAPQGGAPRWFSAAALSRSPPAAATPDAAGSPQWFRP